MLRTPGSGPPARAKVRDGDYTVMWMTSGLRLSAHMAAKTYMYELPESVRKINQWANTSTWLMIDGPAGPKSAAKASNALDPHGSSFPSPSSASCLYVSISSSNSLRYMRKTLTKSPFSASICSLDTTE